jgi:hypothetical protein
LIGAAFFLAPTIADAGTLYCIAGNPLITQFCTPTSPNPLSFGDTNLGEVAGITSNRVLSPANLGVSVVAVTAGTFRAQAGMSGYAITFTGSGSGTASANLVLNGNLFVSEFGNPAQLNIQGSINAPPPASGTGQFSGSLTAEGVSRNQTIVGSGVLANLTSSSGSFVTPSFTVSSGETVTLDLAITGIAICNPHKR